MATRGSAASLAWLPLTDEFRLDRCQFGSVHPCKSEWTLIRTLRFILLFTNGLRFPRSSSGDTISAVKSAVQALQLFLPTV